MSTEIPVIGSETTSRSTLLSVSSSDGDFSLPLIGTETSSSSSLLSTSTCDSDSSHSESDTASQSTLSLPLIGAEVASPSSVEVFSTSNKCLDLILQMYLQDSMLTSDASSPHLSCHPECSRGSNIHVHHSGNEIRVEGIGSIQALFVNKTFYHTLTPLVYSRMELFCGLSKFGPEYKESKHDDSEHDESKNKDPERKEPKKDCPVSFHEVMGSLERIPNLQRHVRHVEFNVPLLYTLYHFWMWKVIACRSRTDLVPHESPMCLDIPKFAMYFKHFAQLDQLKVVVEHSGTGYGRKGRGLQPHLDWLLPLWDMSRVAMIPVSLHFICSVDDCDDRVKNKLRKAWRLCRAREVEWPTLKLGLSAFSLTKLTFKEKFRWIRVVHCGETCKAENRPKGTEVDNGKEDEAVVAKISDEYIL